MKLIFKLLFSFSAAAGALLLSGCGMFGGLEEVKFRYAFRMSGELADRIPGFASQCTVCGACLEKCPQEIPIPEMLARVTAELEDAALMDRVAAARKIFQIDAKQVS